MINSILTKQNKIYALGRYSKGAALVETILILPVLFILIVGLMNIGSLLWQVALASDAVRHGTRAAARSSIMSQMQPCTDIISQANNATQNYISQTLQIPQHAWQFGSWPTGANGAQVCHVEAEETGINSVLIVRQKIQITDTADGTCLFCYGGIAQKILPSVSMAFILPGGCCNYDPDMGACGGLPECDA